MTRRRITCFAVRYLSVSTSSPDNYANAVKVIDQMAENIKPLGGKKHRDYLYIVLSSWLSGLDLVSIFVVYLKFTAFSSGILRGNAVSNAALWDNSLGLLYDKVAGQVEIMSRLQVISFRFSLIFFSFSINARRHSNLPSSRPCCCVFASELHHRMLIS